MTTTETMLGTALAFANRDLAVLPANWLIEHKGKQICSCRCELRGMPPCSKPAKHPYGLLVPNGLLDASTEPWQIKLWWQRAPQANLAVECTGLIVVDTDPKDGGDESLRQLEAKYGPMPLTWRALSGGGGTHDYYRNPDGVEVSNVTAKTMDNPPLGPGIDIRTKGGYVIAPPSLHISGRRYAWSVDHHPADISLALAPDWLVERLTKARVTASGADGGIPDPLPSDEWAKLTRTPVTQYHDMAAIKIIGHLLRHGCNYQLALGLMHAWNSGWCTPPIPYAELNHIVDRIARREAARRQADLEARRRQAEYDE